jgi:hypothetical protein
VRVRGRGRGRENTNVRVRGRGRGRENTIVPLGKVENVSKCVLKHVQHPSGLLRRDNQT